MVTTPTEDLAQTIRLELQASADHILTLAADGLDQVKAAKAGADGALDELAGTVCTILEACAFQDLAGQRLSQLVALSPDSSPRPADPLLNGPARAGDGLDQAAADSLFGAATV